MSRTGFRLLDPAKSLRQRVDFVRQLHDREALLPRERQRRFLEADGLGRLARSGARRRDPPVRRPQPARLRRLRDRGPARDARRHDLPDPRVRRRDRRDRPAALGAGVARAAPRSDVYEVSLKAGHFGLVVGSTATDVTWPTVAEWMKWRDGDAELPDGVGRIPDEVEPEESEAGPFDRIGVGAQLALGAGIGAVGALAARSPAPTRTIREIVGDGGGRLDQLNRLGRVGAGTQISFGLLLDEQAERAPDDVVLLFEDRAHTHTAVKDRVDNVVRGPARDRRPPGRARRRADGDAPECADGRRGAQPARRGRGADAPRRRSRPRGGARQGAADHRRPAERRGRRTPRAGCRSTSSAAAARTASSRPA